MVRVWAGLKRYRGRPAIGASSPLLHATAHVFATQFPDLFYTLSRRSGLLYGSPGFFTTSLAGTLVATSAALPGRSRPVRERQGYKNKYG